MLLWLLGSTPHLDWCFPVVAGRKYQSIYLYNRVNLSQF